MVVGVNLRKTTSIKIATWSLLAGVKGSPSFHWTFIISTLSGSPASYFSLLVMYIKHHGPQNNPLLLVHAAQSQRNCGLSDPVDRCHPTFLCLPLLHVDLKNWCQCFKFSQFTILSHVIGNLESLLFGTLEYGSCTPSKKQLSRTPLASGVLL